MPGIITRTWWNSSRRYKSGVDEGFAVTQCQKDPRFCLPLTKSGASRNFGPIFLPIAYERVGSSVGVWPSSSREALLRLWLPPYGILEEDEATEISDRENTPRQHEAAVYCCKNDLTKAQTALCSHKSLKTHCSSFRKKKYSLPYPGPGLLLSCGAFLYTCNSLCVTIWPISFIFDGSLDPLGPTG